MPDKAIRRMPSSVAKPPSKRPQQRVQGLARLHRLVVVAVQVDEQHPAGKPARSDQRHAPRARPHLLCARVLTSHSIIHKIELVQEIPCTNSEGNRS